MKAIQSLAPKRRPRQAPAPLRLSLLPTFKLETLASITAKHGELLYQRHFGLRMVECKLLGVVLAYEPVSLGRACVELGIDKSLGSRLVARQVQAGLLDRRDDPADQRSFYLVLSAAGRELIARINVVAMERNRDWMAGLAAELQGQFLEQVDHQIGHARAMLEREVQRSRRTPPPAPSHETRGASAREPGPVLVDRQALQDIYLKVGDLLEQSSGARRKNGTDDRRQHGVDARALLGIDHRAELLQESRALPTGRVGKADAEAAGARPMPGWEPRR